MPSSYSTPPSPSKEETKTEGLASVLRDKAKTSKKVAWLLDECIQVPGTKIRFGLDPILGMVPYGGETVATLIGALVLSEAGKKGLPFKTLARVGGNMVLNATVGVIPALGDLFSVWFKSNSRNYEMLNTFLENSDGKEASGGWGPFLFVVGVIGFVLLLNVLTWVVMTLLFAWVWHQFASLFRSP